MRLILTILFCITLFTTKAQYDPDVKAVYETVIKARLLRSGNSAFLMDSVNYYKAGSLKKMARYYNKMNQSDSFDMQLPGDMNSPALQLRLMFTGDKMIVPLSAAGEDSAFQKSGVYGWEIFRKNFPSYLGLVTVSPVYFNTVHTIALCHVEILIGPCGTGAGRFYFMRKNKDNQWQEAGIWESIVPKNNSSEK